MNRWRTLITAVIFCSWPLMAMAQETFGLVTAVRGHAFVVDPQAGSMNIIKNAGSPVMKGQELLTSEGSALRLVDRAGNKYLLGGGSQIAVISDTQVDVITGVVAMESKGSDTVILTSATLCAATKGAGALWVKGENAQWLTVRGTAKTWHPQQRVTALTVAEGLYTESTASHNYLEPRGAREPDVEAAKNFAALFGDSKFYYDVKPTAVRAPASVKNAVIGHQNESKLVTNISSTPSHAQSRVVVLAPPVNSSTAKEMIERLKARMNGEDYDETAHDPRNKVVDAATQRRLAEAARRKGMVAIREKALLQAMGPAAVSRSIASIKEDAKPTVTEKPARYPEELEVEHTSIINRLIKEPKRR